MVSATNATTWQLTAPPVVWTAPAPGLWIANAGENFVAMVEERPDSKYVLKVGGRQFGPFADLPHAQGALSSRLHRSSSGRRDWNLFLAATVVGAICVIAVAALVLVGLR
jgi:hypothetical protein